LVCSRQTKKAKEKQEKPKRQSKALPHSTQEKSKAAIYRRTQKG
jgi:hypothetical protein